MGDSEFEEMLERLMKIDLSTGTEAFRDALLTRCMDVLDAGGSSDEAHLDGFEIDDDDLDLLAAAGDVSLLNGISPDGDNRLI